MSTEITNLIIKADSSDIKNADRDLDGLDKSAKKAGDSTGGLTSKALKMATAFVSVTAVVAVLSAALKTSFDRSVKFQSKFAEVRTLLDESKVSSAQLTTEMQGLSGAFGTMAEKADALYQAISAGIEGENAVKFVGTAAKFAKAGVTDLTTSVDLLTTAINSYGMDASQAGYVSDILFETIKRGKTTASELGETFGRVMATASAVGISFEELNASVAALTVSGVKTSEAMSAMKQVIANIAKPSTEAIELAEKLGIEFGVAGLQSKGLAGFLTELVQKTKGNTQAQVDLFGSVESFNAIAILASESGMARFTSALDGMRDSAGNTFSALEKFHGTFAYEWERFWNNLYKNTSGVSGALGEVLEQMNENIELQNAFDQAMARNGGNNRQSIAAGQGQQNGRTGQFGNVGLMTGSREQEVQFNAMMKRVKTLNQDMAADFNTGSYNMIGIVSRYGEELGKLLPQMAAWGIETSDAMARVVEYNEVMDQEKKLIDLVSGSGYSLEQQMKTYAPIVMDLVTKHKKLTDEALDPTIAKMYELALAMEEAGKVQIVSKKTLEEIDALGIAAYNEQVLILGFKEIQAKAIQKFDKEQLEATKLRIDKAGELAYAEQIRQIESDAIMLDEKNKHQEEMLKSQKDYNEQIQKLKEDAAGMDIALTKQRDQIVLQAKEQFFNNLASLMNTSNKKMFIVGKVAAIAQATLEGYQAVMSAYAKGMASGGPWTAAAYAAAAGIASANLIANIAGASFGGGGGPGTSIGQGSSGYSSGNYFSQPQSASDNTNVLMELADAIKALQGISPGQVVTMGFAQGGAVAVMGDSGVSELAHEITGSVYV